MSKNRLNSPFLIENSTPLIENVDLACTANTATLHCQYGDIALPVRRHCTANTATFATTKKWVIDCYYAFFGISSNLLRYCKCNKYRRGRQAASQLAAQPLPQGNRGSRKRREFSQLTGNFVFLVHSLRNILSEPFREKCSATKKRQTYNIPGSK